MGELASSGERTGLASNQGAWESVGTEEGYGGGTQRAGSIAWDLAGAVDGGAIRGAVER